MLPWNTSGAFVEFAAFTTVAIRSSKLLYVIFTSTFGYAFSYAGTSFSMRGFSATSAHIVRVVSPPLSTSAAVTLLVTSGWSAPWVEPPAPGAEQPARATTSPMAGSAASRGRRRAAAVMVTSGS